MSILEPAHRNVLVTVTSPKYTGSNMRATKRIDSRNGSVRGGFFITSPKYIDRSESLMKQVVAEFSRHRNILTQVQSHRNMLVTVRIHKNVFATMCRF